MSPMMVGVIGYYQLHIQYTIVFNHITQCHLNFKWNWCKFGIWLHKPSCRWYL